MILADTSIWIDYFNGKITNETNFLDNALAEGNVIIGDLVILEILQGIKHDKDYTKTKKALETLEQFELFGSSMIFDCANNFRKLKKKGLTIRKTADLIIASFCIKNKIPLLFSDRDFLPFAEHLGLISAWKKT
ncbi:MAG: PIN domain nuclease [Candidatus Brocadiaceae bacterium]|nr:PIN domain nuclease [Candidatus Brocadiaceae bacterium]